MNKKNPVLLVAMSLLLFISCDNAPTANKAASANAEIKKGVAPIADNEVAVVEMENSAAYGTIKIELYSNIAPKMVARFKELAREGFYNGVTFHRVNQSVIQAGDPLSKDSDPVNDGQGGSDKPNVPAEFSDISYETGIVGAARSAQSNDSANSQFFITLKREAGFVPTGDGSLNEKGIPQKSERPAENILIKTITIQPK
jgi:cyclophilin family peptidyl-prolyl cis-trans isomerase